MKPQVGVGAYNYTELQGIASAPDTSNVFLATNFTGLNATIATNIAAQICQSMDIYFE